jgi:hypothetical protein
MGAYHFFGKPLLKPFQKYHTHTHLFVTVEKFWSPQKGVIEKISVATMLVTENFGHHKVWQLKKFDRHIMWRLIFFFNYRMVQ